MEYSRRFDKINAGFALRAGLLLDQYRLIAPTLPPEQRYDATLVVCVMQALLTHCRELLTYMEEGDQKEFFERLINDTPHEWGLSRSMIKVNTFPDDEVTLGRLLEHLRDAMSHPADSESLYPTTGYTTIPYDTKDVSAPDETKDVSAFRFTNSPWVRDGKLTHKALSRDRAAIQKTIATYKTGCLQLREDPDGKFGIDRDGKRFVQVFVVELPLQVLIGLAQHLSTYLAQPTQDPWDGKSILPLAALSASWPG
jgi:hypothetical protein